MRLYLVGTCKLIASLTCDQLEKLFLKQKLIEINNSSLKMMGRNRMIFLGSTRSGDQSDAPAKASMLALGMVIRTTLQLIHFSRATLASEDGLLGDVSEASLPANNPSVAYEIVQTHLQKWRRI